MQGDEALRLQMENMNLKGENRSLRGAHAVALAKLARGEDSSVSFASPGSRFHQPPGGWNEVTTCEAVKKAEIATLGPIIEKAAKVKVFHLPACKQLFVKGTAIYKSHVWISSRVFARELGRRAAKGGCCNAEA